MALVLAGDHIGSVAVIESFAEAMRTENDGDDGETAAGGRAGEVIVKVQPRPALPALPMVSPERGQPERELASRLSVPPNVVARITGTVTILEPGGGKVEVGLGIKARKQRLVSVGWVRLRPILADGREVWEYSGLAERTLREVSDRATS